MEELKDFFKALLLKMACSHNWETYHRARLFTNPEDELPHTTYDTLICKKCGKIQKVKLN